MTYGDGLSDVNINDLIAYHNINKKLATVTAVRPLARFGAIDLDEGMVKNFIEKPKTSSGWVNGGFLYCLKKLYNTLIHATRLGKVDLFLDW